MPDRLTPGPYHVAPAEDSARFDYAVRDRRGEVAHVAGRRDAALLAAAPTMLAALADLYDLCTLGASTDAFRNGVTDSTGSVDEGDVRASRLLDAARAAIAAALHPVEGIGTPVEGIGTTPTRGNSDV